MAIYKTSVHPALQRQWDQQKREAAQQPRTPPAPLGPDIDLETIPMGEELPRPKPATPAAGPPRRRTAHEHRELHQAAVAAGRARRQAEVEEQRHQPDRSRQHQERVRLLPDDGPTRGRAVLPRQPARPKREPPAVIEGSVIEAIRERAPTSGEAAGFTALPNLWIYGEVGARLERLARGTAWLVGVLLRYAERKDHVIKASKATLCRLTGIRKAETLDRRLRCSRGSTRSWRFPPCSGSCRAPASTMRSAWTASRS